MLQAANTNLFNPLVLKVHNSECQTLPFSVQIKPGKSQLVVVGGFLFFRHTNGLK